MNLSVLRKLHGNGRIRKSALLLEKLERSYSPQNSNHKPNEVALEIATFLAAEAESSNEVILATKRFLNPDNVETPLRRINDFRHDLMRISGQAPADWDFIDHQVKAQDRKPIKDLRVYLEDIRSPFNVGTILRTAEAFGFEEVLLSLGCADPRHPRALRSAMGAVDMIPWRRIVDAELSNLAPLIALELGGEDIREFDFPSKGTLVLGSEELGVSTRILEIQGLSRISIPMRGMKASINVAVAFGIAAEAWSGIFR